ncbi:nucleotidyltransferase [Curtobacterium sp. MCBA15_007]|uniref:nucleotide-binding domain-containing protein n=1 Tax=Curtobacterium sp. MCBA15_007 TaxID=1898735 RepID=UPI0008DE627C|nr:nucleotidyltransferase [Curtobacterium sp. MCBA15_007]OII01413.1 nucleotidyltransferase [Curtobacterium sp. MCBA15_007]
MTTTSDMFDGLMTNLTVDTSDKIAQRRDEITKSLNFEFRSIEGSTANKLMVGSYGRWTATRGISDLDLLFILPASVRNDYTKAGGPSRLLARVRKAIEKRYANTSVTVDRLVVVVHFRDFKFEVQPVFENTDSYSYPDTKSDSWKLTKPRAEIDEMRAENIRTNGSLRRLCKLVRAWKNKHGVPISGLLIDTLVYNFIGDRTEFHSSSAVFDDEMVKEFFLFLAEEEDHDFYAAVGSKQRVAVKGRFQPKARKAYNLALKAIEADGQKNAYKKWRDIFGRVVPAPASDALAASATRFADTEEFVEDSYRVDIRYSVGIDCEVTQDGFRPSMLREMLQRRTWLLPRKQLKFRIVHTDVPGPFVVRWKVLNRGPEAERRDAIRGGLIEPNYGRERHETTSFSGTHHVECYLIQDGTVVARDDIEVPITTS